MANKTQGNPNDIKYFKVDVDGEDITNMVLQTDIFQDLFMPTWSAQLAFQDTQNLLMNLPIKPGSEVTITVETEYPTNELKNFKFIVYKITDRILIKQEVQGYLIHCISKEFYVNQKQRVSKSFKNKKPEQIVDEICQEFGLGELEDKDSDSTTYSMIVPYMSPIAAINWISRFTKNPQGGADYVFFQSDTKKFKYKSLDKMLKDRSGVKFKQLNPNVLDDGIHPDENFLNIEFYEILTQHDSMNNFAAGYYGNKVINYNVYDKTINTSDFSYGDDIEQDKQNAPFDGDMFDGAHNSHVVYHPTATNSLGSNVTTPGDTYGDWLGSRKTNIMKFEENRLVMTVPGVASHWKLLGKQVDVELPSHQDYDEGQYLDKYMKGSYVVAAIRHTIIQSMYKITFEMTKKRVETPYE